VIIITVSDSSLPTKVAFKFYRKWFPVLLTLFFYVWVTFSNLLIHMEWPNSYNIYLYQGFQNLWCQDYNEEMPRQLGIQDLVHTCHQSLKHSFIIDLDRTPTVWITDKSQKTFLFLIVVFILNLHILLQQMLSQITMYFLSCTFSILLNTMRKR
jgi:hypothetical protein